MNKRSPNISCESDPSLMHTQEVQVIRTVAFHPCCHGSRQPQHVDQQSEAGFGVNSLPVAQRSGTSVW
ncbi:hypothetical protein PBY51_011571 [Eleginops maclovinus]|uniref:Uncharacterized protein n=1 Tax=Eleginops maclovinus TaxID=56733 RepID=A0AAN7XTC8_ELEMC|nr:hypothetical protein PBY51_011571 [Eleginops maclovinus]